jgi:hypothetical protein
MEGRSLQNHATVRSVGDLLIPGCAGGGRQLPEVDKSKAAFAAKCAADLSRVRTAGEPGRTVSDDTVIRDVPLPRTLHHALDFTPVVNEPAIWFGLARGGALVRLDSTTGECERLGVVEIRAEPDHEPWNNHPLAPRLHVSPRGDFMAVVNDYGSFGAVYEVRSSRRTLELDGGDYHPETVPFSFAFVEHGGRVVAIHRTAWNRLDASDAATGELLTERGPTSYARGEPRPAHYLDYFHGRLIVSPDGNRILDDGWVWHPVGIPSVWNLRVWLDSNVWESEDGPTRLDLAHREYYWDHAMCWLGPNRVVLAGIGDDEDEIVDGARVFAADEASGPQQTRWRSARELDTLAGPSGDFFSDGRRLFSSSGDGLSIWDVEAGEKIAHVDGFRPTRQHPGSHELVEVLGSRLRIWRHSTA